MRKIRLIFAVILMVVFIVFGVLTFVKDFKNGLSDKGFPDDGANTSIAEAKQKGVLVCEATVMPMHTEWQGQSVDFDSAWIERKVKTKPYFVWWNKVEARPDYYLVIRGKPENRILDGDDPMIWLARAGAGNSFGRHGTNSFDDGLDDSEFNTGRAVVYLVTDWKAPRTNPIVVSWKR